MEKNLFGSVKEWYMYMWNVIRQFFLSIACFVFGIVSGIVSVLVWIWRKAVGMVSRFPNIALGTFLVIICVTWLLWFAKYRATKVGLESQRDSIAWQYQSFREGHGYE